MTATPGRCQASSHHSQKGEGTPMSADGFTTLHTARCCQCTGPVVPASRPNAAGLHWWCNRCAAKPVLDNRSLDGVYDTVAAFAQQHLGLPMRQWLPQDAVRLVNASEWGAAATSPPLGDAVTQVRLHSSGEHESTRGRELLHAEVRLLRGMPFIQTAEVLAHEAFHVFSASQGLNFTRTWEEGTANLWGYLFLAVHPGSQLSETLREGLLQSPDAVYGDGFRLARRSYKASRGFGDYLQRVRVVAKSCP
jgi:hypothetical protein